MKHLQARTGQSGARAHWLIRHRADIGWALGALAIGIPSLLFVLNLMGTT